MRAMLQSLDDAIAGDIEAKRALQHDLLMLVAEVEMRKALTAAVVEGSGGPIYKMPQHRAASIKGGHAKAARLAQEAADGGGPDAWMLPLWEAAYCQLEAECGKQRGRSRLALLAQRLAGPGHPDHHRRKELTPDRARVYLRSLKSKSDPR